MTTLRIKVETRGQKRLGELLKLAKLISESESAIGVERSLLEKKMLGETLVSSGLTNSSRMRQCHNSAQSLRRFHTQAVQVEVIAVGVYLNSFCSCSLASVPTVTTEQPNTSNCPDSFGRKSR